MIMKFDVIVPKNGVDIVINESEHVYAEMTVLAKYIGGEKK